MSAAGRVFYQVLHLRECIVAVSQLMLSKLPQQVLSVYNRHPASCSDRSMKVKRALEADTKAAKSQAITLILAVHLLSCIVYLRTAYNTLCFSIKVSN